MSLDTAQSESPVLTSADALVDWFRAAERKEGPHLVGLEHEKLLFRVQDQGPVPYEGADGVGALLGRLEAQGWSAFREAPDLPVIALQRGAETISLEPGGQLELSGSPLPTARQAHEENLRHLRELEAAARPLGLGAAALGYRPTGTVASMPWMPKSRYGAMRQSLGARGAYALDMMLMTATGQVSLDWRDEGDCARKVTLAARAAPLFVALYANSPFRHGAPSGWLSFRSHVWSDVDRARTGFTAAMLDGHFDYRAYVEWALDAPLLFLRRQGRYLAPRLTFRELLARGFDGEPARLSDWVDHASTLFPEVRIKRVLEFRSADACTPELTGALAAALRGLLYDGAALDAGLRLLPAPTLEAHRALHADAARLGLRATRAGHTLGALAVELLGFAREGLRRLGDGDETLLEPLVEVARSGRSPAEALLERTSGDASLALAATALWRPAPTSP